MLKNQEQISNIQVAGNIISHIFVVLEEYLQEGMSTYDIDQYILSLIIKEGGSAAFYGYNGFPASSCISINEEIIHGIPSKQKIITQGDVVSIDVGVSYQGGIADSAYTYCIGPTSDEITTLLTTTKLALQKGVEAAIPKNHISDISKAVQQPALENNLGIVKQYCGHGVGIELHESPEIPNYFPHNGSNTRLRPNMVIAIEPMFTLGSHEVAHREDNFTVISKDSSLAAHFEHTVLITEKGNKILT